LKAGTRAPDFRLPRLAGGELSLGELRGRRVLLVFSSPHCGPCNTVAPELQRFHRHHPEISVVMVSRGEPDENRAKVKEHRLTFPVVLQQQWEISRQYAMFATPVAYLINESGVIVQDVAVGVEPILALMEKAKELVEQQRPMTTVA
jgi:peroxiredoxin